MANNKDTRQQLNAELAALKARIEELESSQASTQAARHESFYRDLVEDMPVQICRLLPDGMLTYVNTTFCEYFDRRPEDLIGRDFFEFIPAAEREAVRSGISSLTIENPEITFEHKFVGPNGEKRWQRWTYLALFDPQGGTFEYQSIGEDITESKHMEVYLRESEEKFRMLFAAAQDAIVLVDAETRQILDVNEAAVALYGYDREKMIQMNALELSADPEKSKRFIGNTLATSDTETILHINVHKKKGGAIFPVEISSGVIQLQDQKLIYAMFRDITARMEAEAELRESRERFRQLAENIEEVFWLFDWEAQKVLYVSPAYENVWKRSRKDLYEDYTEWGESIHPDDVDHANASFQKIVESGGGEDREYRIVQPDGSIRWLSDRGFAILDAEGNVVRIAGLATDITDRKQSEEEREVLIQKLEAKNAELERFTYTVSHDLKSPLITIRGFLGYLEKDARTGNLDRLKVDLDRIASAADKMELLLDELLELSRIGRIINPPELLSLADLVQEALDGFADRLATRGAKVIVEPNLPAVYGDRIRLLEVIENLIENGIRYFGEEPEPCLEIGRKAGEDPPVFFVRDNGIGIDPLYLERIFELFEQLTPDQEGSGVGLAIVKRIIEVHGGRIWAESEGKGQGTTFYFTLPLPDEKKQIPGEKS